MKNIKTSPCTKCKNAVVDDKDPKHVLIYCKRKLKTFYFGQRILCDNYKEKP